MHLQEIYFKSPNYQTLSLLKSKAHKFQQGIRAKLRVIKRMMQKPSHMQTQCSYLLTSPTITSQRQEFSKPEKIQKTVHGAEDPKQTHCMYLKIMKNRKTTPIMQC
jgi:hypothetical protein